LFAAQQVTVPENVIWRARMVCASATPISANKPVLPRKTDLNFLLSCVFGRQGAGIAHQPFFRLYAHHHRPSERSPALLFPQLHDLHRPALVKRFFRVSWSMDLRRKRGVRWLF
jgi:hypothetical protein